MRARNLIAAASLVLFPLLILMYWVLYPAYGILDAAAGLRAIDGHGPITAVSDAFAMAGIFLSVPAILALMRVLGGRSPRLTLLGGGLSLVGWIALVGLIIGDVVATQMVEQGPLTASVVDLYSHIMNSPMMIALTVIALLHVVGGILIGVALWRSRLVPKWAAIVATITPPVHLASNLAGLLWIDSATWVALSAAFACVVPLVLRDGDRAV